MRILLNPVFILCVLLFLAHQWAQHLGFHQTFIDSYLDDVLCMPVILTIATAFMRMVKRNPALQLSWMQIAFAFAQVAVTFELLLPWVASKYHGDPWDLLAYAAGTAVWWFTIR